MKTDYTSKGNSLFNKKIVLFLISQNISLFGSSVVGYAIIWHITLETSSGFWLMLFTICSSLPQVVMSLWGGVWADRYNRKYLIMLSDAFIALTTLGLAVSFWMGFQRIELLLIASVVRSIGAGVQTPAVNAIYPQLVPQEGLTKIQGLNQTLNSVLMLLSPAVGGVLLGSMDIAWAFMVDVVTAALAIMITGFIKVERIQRTDESTSVFTELKQGIDFTFCHPLLRGIIICYACSFFLITPAAVLTSLMVERSFGDDVWRLTANEIVWTIGTLVGGLFVSLHGSFKDKIRTIVICLAGFGVTFGLLGVAGNFTVYLIIMGTAGLFLPVMTTAQTVFIQEITQPAMMGRVFSIIQIISASSMPVAILLFGPLADAMPIETILIVSGILLVLVAVVYYYSYKKNYSKMSISDFE